jgi:nucleotide-binding universal stress UspA family protein
VHAPEAAQHEIREGAPIRGGIDGSAASEAAVELAFDEALHRGVPLVALHAWSDVAVFPLLGMDWRTYRGEGDEVLGERLAGWQERYPEVQVHRRLVCDVPARWLIDQSDHAQLVVLGSRGRGGYAGMRLGSVSSAVLQSVRVSRHRDPAARECHQRQRPDPLCERMVGREADEIGGR